MQINNFICNKKKITRSKNTGKKKKIYLKNIIRIIIIFLSLTYILSMLLVFNEGN